VYTIYLIEDHRNKPYVGVTSRTPEERLRDHKKRARRGVDTHLYNAMRKYGTEEFEIIPLDTASSKEESYELEKEWIERLGAYEDWGYNMTLGGEGALTPEIRKKISETKSGKNTGENNHMYGREHTEETKNKISKAKSGENNPMYGGQLSKQHKQRIRESLQGREFPKEHKRKISEALSSRELSEEHKQKMSEVQKGENSNTAKLTADEAAEVKYLAHNSKELTQPEIGEIYGVSREAVSSIKTERSWSHIEPRAPAQGEA
jgi:group I intron endonuclease